MGFYFGTFSGAAAGISPLGIWLLNAVLVAVLITCAYTDGTRGKIFNKVTFPAMGLGLLLNGIFGGVTGLGWSLLGLGLGLAMQWVPWMLGLAKAGDVKLLMAVGALKGWAFCAFGFLYGAAAFGILSLPWLLRRGELKGVGRNIKNYAVLAAMSAGVAAPDTPTPTVTKKFVPWGVGLCAGFAVALIVEVWLGRPFWWTG